LVQNEGLDAAVYREGTLQRFAQDYNDDIRKQDVIDMAAGERRESLIARADEGDEQAIELRDGIYALVRDYANGNYADDESFEAEQRRLFAANTRSGWTQETIGDARVYASNLKKIADVIRARASESGVSIDSLLEKTEIVIGQARVGARTEHHMTATERIYDKLGKFGWAGSVLANEVTISAAVSAASFITKDVVGSVAAHYILPGVAGGAFAGIREARALKGERTEHMREMASGKASVDDLEGRRIDLEGTRYETRSATELIAEINNLYGDDGELNIGSDDELENALDVIARIQARRHLSDEEGIDLISFSSPDQITAERDALRMAVIRARVGVQRQLRGRDLSGYPVGETVQREGLDAVLDAREDPHIGTMGEMLDDRDAVYRRLRNKRVAWAVAKGTMIGVGVGGVEYALHAGITAAAEALGGGGGGHTAAAAAGNLGPRNNPNIPLSGNTNTLNLDQHASLSLPSEFHVTHQGSAVTITGPDNYQAVHLTLDKQGMLTAQDKLVLKSAGFDVSSTHAIFTGEAAPHTLHGVTVSTG
jgi:hypothetical protein